jgi:hypothetical protein
VYFYNKNNLKNISINNSIVNKIIKSYFSLFFLNYKNINPKKRRTFLKNIYISNTEIKYTNNLAMITLYTVNLKKHIFTEYMNYFYNYSIIRELQIINENKKPITIIKFIKKNLFKFIDINAKFLKNNDADMQFLNLKEILNYKLKILNKNIEFYNLYRKAFLIKEIKYLYYKYLVALYKYNNDYFSNNLKFKFDNSSFILKLKSKLSKILNKKIILNIINLKSITYNADIFTKALTAKLKKKSFNVIKSMITIINKGKIIERNFFSETKNKNYNDINLISTINCINLENKLKEIYPTNIFPIINYNKIINIIFNSIKYKNLGGIRLEVKGRLTRRYRADRAIYKLF